MTGLFNFGEKAMKCMKHNNRSNETIVAKALKREEGEGEENGGKV